MTDTVPDQQKLDESIEEAVAIRHDMENLKNLYEEKRKEIFDALSAQNTFRYACKNIEVIRSTEKKSEIVTKASLIEALKELDIPRETKILVYKKALREIVLQPRITIREKRREGGVSGTMG
jgi:uncharacterized membrane protein YgaE (UPF0421/DUF939 family)